MEQNARPSQGTILVVDDEPDIVSLLEEYFSSQGFRVLTALDGETALKRAEHSPDLIVLDVGMPFMDGYAVCRRLREHLSCPIVFLTARVEDVDALEGFEAGADDYVLKPFSPCWARACGRTSRARAATKRRPRCASTATSSSTIGRAPCRWREPPWN